MKQKKKKTKKNLMTSSSQSLEQFYLYFITLKIFANKNPSNLLPKNQWLVVNHMCKSILDKLLLFLFI